LYGKLRFTTLQSWSFASNYIPKLELGNEKNLQQHPLPLDKGWGEGEKLA